MIEEASCITTCDVDWGARPSRMHLSCARGAIRRLHSCDRRIVIDIVWKYVCHLGVIVGLVYFLEISLTLGRYTGNTPGYGLPRAILRTQRSKHGVTTDRQVAVRREWETGVDWGPGEGYYVNGSDGGHAQALASASRVRLSPQR